jgi:hypothetical protein
MLENGMTCEEFATAGLDLGAANGDGLLQTAAREHLRECPHCAVLHENWLALHEDLQMLGAETAEAEVPSRVEMRLRQEFRTKHKTIKRQRAALVLSWSLATAAALFCVFAWLNWHLHRGGNEIAATGSPAVHTAIPAKDTQAAAKGTAPSEKNPGDVLIASNAGDFTLLPDSMPPAPEDATVVHVQMQRAALEALGFTVNEEHAGDWIKVDLLVGDDGLPQAVRFPQTTSSK